MAVRFILSIDGGGIRGLIPALILSDLAKRLDDRPLHECFDLIGGTSTGAIIAAGLACPNPRNHAKAACTPDNLVKLYAEEGKDIFKATILTRILNIGGWQEERYSAAELEKKLINRLGLKTEVADALTKVLITGYDIHNRQAVFITNCDPENSRFRFWEAARGSSAAPTYFEPALVENFAEDPTDANRRIPVIDGGVFANDPVLAAYVEARKMGWENNPDTVVILSLGTGIQNRKIPYQQAKDWGAFGWINPANGTPLISVLMQGQASTAAYQANKLLNPSGTKMANGATAVTAANRGKLQYFRIDGPLIGANDDLDDASPGNIASLTRLAERFITDNKLALDEVASRIKAR
ncbi:patatin-like phospholipase family protein [Rhizobiaceae bacterium n13]|uniref:Patatin-like phospholipase family protein n=1 Tax=Ferirhizobium litorale TaxID=2927786 RepID=A0AAE3U2X0_9HYPH|nr:patatin-like phospholipase family protein [Fererhizobium litorale]MDI7861332.1 patatin-like phospholipase family protein [Fererhizobium litorale]MDI7921479.1 patatin-like phospholipase family protein [Fererhizobium litorale]